MNPIENQQPNESEMPYMPQQYSPEGAIDNIVEQINPQQIIDNFNHALQGEYYNKEKGVWEMNASKEPLVNDSCRGWVISFLTGIMNNSSTMGIIDKNQLSSLMMGVINCVKREFVLNLEKFGFVPPGKGYEKKYYENKGTPNSARMTSIAEMIYQRSFLIYTRSLNGMESRKIFSSLSMSDNFGGGNQSNPSGGWMSKLMGT